MVDLISCEACGNTVSAAAAACPKCGHPQSKPRPKVSYEIEDETKLSGAQRIGLGVIAVLVILGGMFWVLNKINSWAGRNNADAGQEIELVEVPIGDGLDFGSYTVTIERVHLDKATGAGFLAALVGADSLANAAAMEGGVLVLVDYKVLNSGTEPLSPTNRPRIQLKDNNGTLIEPDQGKTKAYNFYGFDDRRERVINPGLSVTEKLVFEVVEAQFDPKTWKLVVDGGALVSLASLAEPEPAPAAEAAPVEGATAPEASTSAASGDAAPVGDDRAGTVSAPPASFPCEPKAPSLTRGFDTANAYPEDAKRRGWTGRVTFEYSVDENGNPVNVNIVDAYPEGIFEQAVKAEASKMRWSPATNEYCQPVPSDVRKQVIVFSMG